MLKALELFGFKSFADKTRFEFPPGITVVVGPNGSGKSNVVDAMKWVLGEQSAKSLRGREMADVIFKGSGAGSGGRRPANAAEVTIVFDNADAALPLDTPEVRVTRRVYRSGEGEYLINGNPCRLRDLKDLFRGTGVGTDAYSLIEQGKVDTLLQASPRERRAIFEEAAGISRFKAKKLETQRRLERVEQNLTRLADIVEEVESRLRSVRSQATKAQRYREFTERLRQLRTQVGLVDWRVYTDRLREQEEQLQMLEEQASEVQAELDSADRQARELDDEGQRLSEALHDAETSISGLRQEIAGHLTTVQHEHLRQADLEQEIQRHRRQCLSMETRVRELQQQREQLERQLIEVEQSDHEMRGRLLRSERELGATTDQLASLRRSRELRQEEHTVQLKQGSELDRQMAALEVEIQAADAAAQRGQQQQQDAEQQLHEANTRREQLVQLETRLDQEESDSRERLQSARRMLHSNEQDLSQQRQQLVDLQRRHAVATERAKVLQDLERRKEGLGSGVKDLLARAHDSPLGPLATVRGMVADLVRVDVRMAPLIDAALGDLTQYLVVQGSALAEALATGEIHPKGRVGLLELREESSPSDTSAVNLHGRRAVLGRADEFVECDPPFRTLIQQLLGNTWCVETLADALRLQRELPTPPRFVTRSGELVEARGRILAGPRQSVLGLVSRRSELRALQQEILQLEQEMMRAETEVTRIKDDIAAAERQVDEHAAQYERTASELMEARLKSGTARDRVQSLEATVEGLKHEWEEVQTRRQVTESGLHALREERKVVDQRIDELVAALTQYDQQTQQLEAFSQQQLLQVTRDKVELAKSEQRVSDLRRQVQRCQEDHRERIRALGESQSHRQAAQDRSQQATHTILHATSLLAELHLSAETQERSVFERRCRLDEINQQRSARQERLARLRQQWQQLEQDRHQRELEANRARLERDSLAQRVREDYGIELAELEELPTTEEEQRQREEVDREIADLRRRIGNLGAVNMAALEEIESLEERYQSLDSQYQDLVQAKESLDRIIQRINADSRRLFTESLEAIRTNFQSLFRRVFGGGEANIVLEEGVDLLEAGVDIVATPPGKHSLGISLLSGGERALTAVTLLLAIFQYRPSPFCVLDEVDGPLDEANIGRFVDVLNEFLAWTKFVIVTHSKKTMTAATTLYGVTMQESGISKRVSVQFDDVSEDGEIRREALQTDSLTDSAEEDDERGAA